jgi:hypothetical protein
MKMKPLKGVFQFLSIGLLAAGCISPISQKTVESPPQSTVETPEVTSSPTHPPEGNPTETPRPGWMVYTDPRLDILFQLPAAWQRVERNGALHQFEGASGYISFSDLLPPMIFDENVEKICQNQIEFANKKYQDFGQKPYGSQPEVISLQVDGQPACLILPSADQAQDFERIRSSFLIAKYPTDLEVEPGHPRFLTLEADKDHIQSIAEAVHFITKETGQTIEHLHLPNVSPSLQATPSSTPIAGLTPTQPLGQVLPTNFTPDDPTVQSILKSYLVQNIGLASFGGKVFCAYQPLADPVKDQDGSRVHVYLWVLCQEYYRDGQGLQKGTGSSLPVAIELIKATGRYQFNSYKVPGDGSFFPKDVRAEFPPSTWKEIMPGSRQEDIEAYNARAHQLEAETKAEAEKEFPAQSAPSSQPLGLQSSSDEIRDHLLHPVWNTLWVDGYSFSNYDGETATFFVQAWIDRDGGGRLISSDQLTGAVEREAGISPRFAWASDGTQIRFADLWRDPIYVQEISPPVNRHPLEEAARAGAFIGMLLPKGPDDFPYFFRPVRMETVSGREALVVEASWDASSPAFDRFWVDQITGVILRSEAIGYDGMTIVHESSVDSIRYNPVLPPTALSLDDFSNVHFEDNPSLIPSPQAPSQPDTVSISVSAPETYTATVPVSETLGMDQEAIVRTLFEQYLNYFKIEPLPPSFRLDDYEITSVDLDPRIQTMATIEKRADYVARVIFSVKPVLMIYSNWEAGNGTTHADKWIQDKELIVGVIHTGNIYRLSLIGTG